MMIPTTLATTSRKESKLNGISRWRLRLRIMTLHHAKMTRATFIDSSCAEPRLHSHQGFPGSWADAKAPTPGRRGNKSAIHPAEAETESAEAGSRHPSRMRQSPLVDARSSAESPSEEIDSRFHDRRGSSQGLVILRDRQ